MRSVVVAGVNSLSPDNYWSRGIAELALDAAAPLAANADAIFAGSISMVQEQADFGAIVADRLGLHTKISLTLDAAEVSGAAALYAAWLHVRAGLCDSALVVAAGKVSDLSEAERLAIMDRALDQDIEIASGLGFASQAGLLAGYYCKTRGTDSTVLSDLSAANYSAWAKHTDGVVLSGLELRRDLVVAPPLVRNDFSQLLDGACAVLLSASNDERLPRLESMATASDTVAIWERSDPLGFRAVKDAANRALAGKKIPSSLEFDTGASIVQLLSQEALVHADGRSSFAINRIGGTQGRGRVPGASPLYQIGDAVEPGVHCSATLAVAVAGLGSRAFAAHIVQGRTQ